MDTGVFVSHISGTISCDTIFGSCVLLVFLWLCIFKMSFIVCVDFCCKQNRPFGKIKIKKTFKKYVIIFALLKCV